MSSVPSFPVAGPGLNHLKALGPGPGPRAPEAAPGGPAEKSPFARLVAAAAASAPPGAPAPAAVAADGDGGLFGALVDIVNPLQHLPIVGDLYRNVTGDRIDAIPRVLGGALFGGPIGAAAAALNAGLAWLTGRDAGEHVIAFLDDGPAPVAVAAVARETSPPAAPAAGPSVPKPAAAPETGPAPRLGTEPAVDLAAGPAGGVPSALVPPAPARLSRHDPVTDALFAERMLSAFDKYRAMNAHGLPPAPHAAPHPAARRAGPGAIVDQVF